MKKMIDWNNEEQVLAAVKNNGYALRYASLELKNNEKIVLAAVSKHGLALQYASPSLKNNRRFCSLIFNRKIKYFEICQKRMYYKI